MKTEVIRILEKRAEHFEKINHSYEAREVKSAIDTIRRLMPPELFAIHGVSERLFTKQDLIDCWVDSALYHIETKASEPADGEGQKWANEHEDNLLNAR